MSNTLDKDLTVACCFHVSSADFFPISFLVGSFHQVVATYCATRKAISRAGVLSGLVFLSVTFMYRYCKPDIFFGTLLVAVLIPFHYAV